MFSQLFCKKKQINNHIFCKRCSKLVSDEKEGCVHKNEQMFLIDFDDKLLNINARLSHENTFQIFDLIQNQQQIICNLEELRITFVGGYQPWMRYLPDPFSRNFKTWKGCHKKLVNLKKLVINLSETRVEDCMEVLFQGFEDLGELSLEELELDFFSILMNTEQLISILQKLSQLKSLKKLSLNIGKLGRIRVTEELIDEFKNVFSSLREITHLSLNISSVSQQGDVQHIESLIQSIDLLPNISQLKLSCKNCRLNTKSMPMIQVFLDSMAQKLTHLDLDISYNAQLGEHMTRCLYTTLKSFKQLRSFSINLKGSDTNFNKQDYLLILKLVYRIFKLSIHRYKSTQAIQDCYIKNISVQLPLTFVRQNLLLCTKNNNLIQNMIKNGPLVYFKFATTPAISKAFRKDILSEIYTEFII